MCSRIVTTLWHLRPSTLSRPYQIQWEYIHFYCSSSSLLLVTTTETWQMCLSELCVYSPTLLEATGAMLPSGKGSAANPLNSMENWTDICVIMWKVYEYVKKNGKMVLLDCGLSTKDEFHLRWKHSSKCNCVLFTRDMACTLCKEDFLSLQQSDKQWYIYLLCNGMMTPTGTEQKPAQ